MAFVQIIEFRTDDIDAFRTVGDEWHAATEGKRTRRRAIVGRDRKDPDHYVELVFFDSYESAMENSSLPETQAAAERLGTLIDGELTFHDLDIIEDDTGKLGPTSTQARGRT